MGGGGGGLVKSPNRNSVRWEALQTLSPAALDNIEMVQGTVLAREACGSVLHAQNRRNTP